MSKAIFLTAEEADKVRGFSPIQEGHVLIPVDTGDGRFMLGVGVLENPAFAYARDFLARLPQGDPVPAKEVTEAEIAADEPARLVVWSAAEPQERSRLLEAAVVMLADESAPLDGLKSRQERIALQSAHESVG